jgi:FAD/FMN-containing dehydrogenase
MNMQEQSPISASLVDALKDSITGELLRPGEAGFDSARSVWNARFDRKPDLVIRCACTDDIAAAVNFARQHDLVISVKGGGHDYAGNTVGEGGLLIDLGLMRTVSVDVRARTAVAEAGATWSDVDAATQPHGLATTGGTVSTVGIAGFTLGGGQGWLTRKYGLAADNLLSAEVVTASGAVVRASSNEHPDLYWGLRGGGGNFGIVSRFEYRLHEFGPDVLAGQVIYPLERARELLRWYRDHMKTAPDEVTAYPFLLRIPPLPDFPAAIQGKVVLDFVAAYAGPVDEAEIHLAPFRAQGSPLMDTIGVVPYTVLQKAFDDGMAKGNRWYSRCLQLDEVSDAFIDTLLDNLDPFPGAFTAVYLGAQGGAVSRVAADATAYPHRGNSDALHIFPGWADPAEDAAVMAWARDLYGKLRPFDEGGVYVNMLAEDEGDRLSQAYKANLGRLAALKKKWDPHNLFRMNHNIPPGD